MGDVWSDLGGVIDARTRKLEGALKLIIGLAAVGALTGVIQLVRGR